ncbi:MAG: sulfite exporter TauE/SafE family protein [Pseudomonadota bacterium]
MNFYLPIAEMSVNVFVFLGMGAAVGFLSGLFGVGGGFLMTPLLIFSGIPAAVAVGTEAAQIVASSVSGAIAQWRRQNVDVKMGVVLLAGGAVGSVVGVQFVKILREAGQFDFVVSLSYVTFLGVVGALMLIESVNTIRKVRQGQAAPSRRPGQHNWIHGLPLKMRFHRSKLYISAIPPLVIGALVGFLAAIMGVGGGFIMVPAMIYLLRVPTNVVVGTSLFQIVFVTGITTVLHAAQNYTVDVVLALLLMIGGVIGAQFGAVAGERLRGEQLRFLLAALVLLVCLRMAWGLIAEPSELYSITSGVTGGHG